MRLKLLIRPKKLYFRYLYLMPEPKAPYFASRQDIMLEVWIAGFYLLIQKFHHHKYQDLYYKQ